MIKFEKIKFSTLNEYTCKITDLLDKLAGFTNDSIFKHYVLIDDYSLQEEILPIRVPGGTVGAIYYDMNNRVMEITLDTNYVVKTYPADVKEHLNIFFGEVISFEGVKSKLFDRLEIGDIVTHFKRDTVDLSKDPNLYKYKILNFAQHTETKELLVIYQAMYSNEEMGVDFGVYARPYYMFMSKVDRTKYPENKFPKIKQTYRFEKYNPSNK